MKYRKRLLQLGLLLAFAALAALAVARSGLVPVDASGGHWAITDWFLHFTMRHAVKRQAQRYEEPALDDPALLRRGAGVYAVSCVGCHGGPGVERAQAAELMTPPAPELPELLGNWRPRELFWIVKYGIKYTAMPAWPAQQRDDEVWAVVAFLRALPRLDAAGYRALAYGDETTVAYEGPVAGPANPGAQTCFQCHGADGGGRDGTAPVLAAQSEAYLYASLRAYADGVRFSGIMQPIAHALDEADMRALSRRFAQMPPAASPRGGDARLAPRGAAIATRGLPEQDVPACESCHAADSAARSPDFPRLDGQDAEYLFDQLRRFRDGARGGTAAAPLMQAAVRDLDDEDARAVAAYYAMRGRRELTPPSADARPGR